MTEMFPLIKQINFKDCNSRYAGKIIINKKYDNIVELNSFDEAAGLIYNLIANGLKKYTTDSTIMEIYDVSKEVLLITLKLDPYGNVCICNKGNILVKYSDWREQKEAQQ